ncbi:MAG: hypothetical protein K0M45_09055 [Candidatus Paracaedibacteraceae bacterium]|nr:hypothetical protein [Candidatus Paracaedibacteraceae bacterium]
MLGDNAGDNWANGRGGLAGITPYEYFFAGGGGFGNLLINEPGNSSVEGTGWDTLAGISQTNTPLPYSASFSKGNNKSDIFMSNNSNGGIDGRAAITYIPTNPLSVSHGNNEGFGSGGGSRSPISSNDRNCSQGGVWRWSRPFLF